MPCRCRVRLAVPLSVFLALALSLSPVLSCYAYAEGSPEGQEAADEAVIDGGADRQPDEGLAQAEPAEHSEVGEGSEEGKAAQPVLLEVPSDAGYGSGGSAGSGVDGSSEDAYSSGWRWAEPSVSGDVEGAYQGAYFSDLASPSQGGIMLLAGFGGSLTGGFGGAFSGGSGLGKSANTTDVVDSFTAAWGWGYNSSVAHLYANSPAGWLKSIKDNTGSIVSKLSSVSSGISSVSSGQDSLLSLLKKQWGYGYGGTVVLESNSPAAWLQKIRDRMVSSRSVVGLSSEEHNVTSLVAVVADTMRRQWGYGYGGTAVISSNSPAAWLSNINDNVSSISKSNSSALSKILASVDRAASYLTYNGQYPISETERLIYNLLFANIKYGEYSVALSAREIRNSLTLLSGTSNVASWIKSISENTSYDGKYPIGETQRLIYGLLKTNLSYGQYSVAESAREIRNAVIKANDLSAVHFDSVSKSLSDILLKLANLKVDVSVSNSDLSLIEGKLDSILDVLRLGLARDVIDTLLGDLNFSRLASLSADVEGAISSAFPFCIPAVMKQVLGLLEYDGSAPVWEFDIAGSPLVCDFRDFQPVADVSGWVARIGFVLVLLANTRRFVFMGWGAVSE